MNVFHIATTVRDGAGIGAWRQHKALTAAGIDSRFMAVIGPEAPDPEFSTAPIRRHSMIRRVSRRLGYEIGEAAAWRRRQARLERGISPDYELFSLPFSDYEPEQSAWFKASNIINIHWVAGVLDYPRFFGNWRKPVIWTLHDQQSYLGGFHYDADRRNNPGLGPLEAACRELKQRSIAGRRHVVVGNSKWNTSNARSSGFFPGGTRFETVYYPLDTERYSPRSKPSSRAALKIGEDRFVVGFASTSLSNKRKGLADLLGALSAIEAGDPGAPLTLLSFGRAPDDEMRRSVGFPWLHLGHLNNDEGKCLAYSAMDCFVIPSHEEAFGQTAIEAQASGTAVIGTRVGGIPETMPASSDRFLFESGDIAAIARLIEGFRGNAALREAAAASGRRHVQSQHSPRGAAESYVAIYRDALAHSETEG